MRKEQQWTTAELGAMSGEEIYRIARDDLRVPMASAMGDDELRRAVIAHAEAAGRLLEDGAAPPSRAAGTEHSSASPAQRPVFAAYPPHEGDFPQLVGRSVTDAIAALRTAWGIVPENTRVYVNGQQVEPGAFAETRLEAGDRLEFARQAGEKG